MGKARVARLRSFGQYENLRIELEIERKGDVSDSAVLKLAARVERLSKKAVANAQGYVDQVDNFGDEKEEE